MPDSGSRFTDDLAYSQDVITHPDIQNYLLQHIPQGLSVHPAHQRNDRLGADLFVQCQQGHFRSVDVKVRACDYARQKTQPNGQKIWINDDYALETWSVRERNQVGWTRDTGKITDYVLWYWVNTQRIAMLPFSELHTVFTRNWEKWLETYGGHCQSTVDKGYHSECVFVPRRVVWTAIYHEFSGEPCPF